VLLPYFEEFKAMWHQSKVKLIKTNWLVKLNNWQEQNFAQSRPGVTNSALFCSKYFDPVALPKQRLLVLQA